MLLAICLGCGLAVERVAGWRLPGALLPVLGLALVIVISTLTTVPSFTASITTAVVVAVALAGYATSWQRVVQLRPEPWSLGVGLALYAICAAPLVLSGNATFLGYFVDSDPAFHLELISWMFAHGRSLSGVPSVSYSVVPNLLHEYIGTHYPTGADVALGSVRPLVGQDLAWIYQPYLAVVIALGGSALFEVLRDVVASRPLRALCAFIAAQSGLIYAFYLEASIKEVAVALLLTVMALLIVDALRRPLAIRVLAPLAIVVVAALDVYSVPIVPWVGPLVALGAVALAWRERDRAIAAWRGRRDRRIARRVTWRAAAWPAATLFVLALAFPVLKGATTFTSVANSVLSQQSDLGNLATPLADWQILGIWPSGDFRYPVASGTRLAFALIGLALGGAVLGVIWMVRRRAYAPLLLLTVNAIAAAALLGRSSPYAASKVLAIVSVGAALAAMLGAVALHDGGWRIEGWGLAAVIAGGVLWTNVIAYHDSSVAPQARMRELASIGARFHGQGPAFYDMWDTFAIYFLRGESVAVPDTNAGPPPVRPGLPPHRAGQASAPWDVNDLAPSYLGSFRLLVLGRSPIISRPPADFRRIYVGRYYEVWRRVSSPVVLRHIQLSGAGAPASAPAPAAACSAIRTAGALAVRDRGLLAYVVRPSLPTLVPTQVAHPRQWAPMTLTPGAAPQLLALGQAPGTLRGTIRVPAPGRYEVMVEGSFSRRVQVRVGGRVVGSFVREIGTSSQFLDAGSVELASGEQPVEVVRPPAGLGPGNVLGGDMLGLVVLVPSQAPAPVQELAPSQAASLCGRSLEWIEVVA